MGECLFLQNKKINPNNWGCSLTKILREISLLYGTKIKDNLTDGTIYIVPTMEKGFIIAHANRDNEHINRIYLMSEKGIKKATQSLIIRIVKKYKNIVKEEMNL